MVNENTDSASLAQQWQIANEKETNLHHGAGL
jgi:hypothetical protein